MKFPNPEHRVHAIDKATVWLHMDPLFLDTETTGFSSNDEIVEIAIVGRTGEVLLNTLLKPTIQIPPSATFVHGITNEMVQAEKTYSQIADDLHQLLSGRAVLIYNMEFDMRMLYQTAWKTGSRGEEFSACRFYDMMTLYAQYRGEWDRFHGNYKWQKLIQAAYQCQIEPPQELHRAAADADLTRRLLLHMANSHE